MAFFTSGKCHAGIFALASASLSTRKRSKPDNYPKLPKVNRADIRWKEYVHNWRGLTGERKRAVGDNFSKMVMVSLLQPISSV